MVPYNEKLWKRDLSELSSDWVDWSIPIPTVDEVIGGALGLENKQMGYNAQFLYPEAGGDWSASPILFTPPEHHWLQQGVNCH